MFYRLSKVIVQIALRVFYRRLEVEGAERVPESGPLLIVSNHVNSLIDPLMIGIHFRRPITITAKHSLTRNVVLAMAFKAYGVIPFFRCEDAGDQGKIARNRQSITTCHARLKQGAAVIIFPEGQSYPESRLRRFKSAAARIALNFETEADDTPLSILPVSLYYEDKDRFRSSVLVRFGHPINVADWKHEHAGNGVRELTRQVKDHIADLSPRPDSAEELNNLDWSVRLVQARRLSLFNDRESADCPFRNQGLKERQILAANLKSRLDICEDRCHVDYLNNEMKLLAGKQITLGFGLESVFVEKETIAVNAWESFRLSLMLLIALPFFLWGFANFLLAILFVFLSVTLVTQSPEQRSSNTIYISGVTIPVFLLLQSVVALILLPLSWSILYIASLAVSGAAMVLFCDSLIDLKQSLSRMRAFRHRPKVTQELKLRCCKLAAELDQTAFHSDSLDLEGRTVPQKESFSCPD